MAGIVRNTGVSGAAGYGGVVLGLPMSQAEYNALFPASLNTAGQGTPYVASAATASSPGFTPTAENAAIGAMNPANSPQPGSTNYSLFQATTPALQPQAVRQFGYGTTLGGQGVLGAGATIRRPTLLGL